jgi:hypothetical protein
VTKLLEQAFAQASKLTEAEQDLLATRLLAELAAEDEFNRLVAGSGEQISSLAAKALDEYRAGLTEPMHPERL